MDGDQEKLVKIETKDDTSSEKREMANEIKSNPLERKKQIFYNLCADATLHFSSGDSIQVNKAMLAFHSKVLADMCLSPSSKSDIKIEEFDSETFQIFLNCLFGFEEYTVINALLIYPIAQKYQVESSLESCIKVLEPPNSPKDMNENICLSLNLALFYKLYPLIESIMTFIEHKFGIINFFEKENYYFLLEPAAILKIVEKVDMNSWYLEVVYKWAENYLQKHDIPVETIRNFFIEHKIWPLIPPTVFESYQSIFDFHEKTSKKKLFTAEEILSYLKLKLLRNPCSFPSKSSWVTINKGDVLKEKIHFKPSLTLVNSEEITLKIHRNLMIHNNFNVGAEEKKIDYECVYNFKENTKIDGIRYSNHEFKSDVFYFYEMCSALHGRNHCILKIKNFNRSIISIDGAYKFHINCKILKTSLDVIPFADNDEKLYFTCLIELS